MNNINGVVETGKCTGCSGCFNVCPVNAISMQKNSEGFLNPEIDVSKCIYCNLCNKACPLLNNRIKPEQRDVPIVYAGWSKNEIIRKKSSSGGVFSVIAQHVLDNNGYVCGATFTDKLRLTHVLISRKSQLEGLRSSKYIQSDIGDSFRKIKSLLDNKRLVLFVGVPCQVAGLKNYLQKDYDSLIAIDIVCHGAPSPKVLDAYIKEIEERSKNKIDKIIFRDKSTGWKTYSFTLRNNKKTIYKNSFSNDQFYNGFLSNLYLMPACTNCQFSGFPKYSDITLGDYWGVSNYKENLDDNRGTSVIILNNSMGDSIFNKIKKFLKYKIIPDFYAVEKLKSISLPYTKHHNRKAFFHDLNCGNYPISKIIDNNLKDCFPDKVQSERRVAIFNMRLPTVNYGAVLQSFALYTAVKRLGYDVKVIDYYSKELNDQTDKFVNFPFVKFRENFLELTRPCISDKDLIELNHDFDSFIVGSDQVWNYRYLSNVFNNDIGKYFLNFVLPSKTILSYAPSFADNTWPGTQEEISEVKNCLKKFVAVSVREASGLEICRTKFGINAKLVLDPTLLLNADDYVKVIQSETHRKEADKYIAYFSLDEGLERKIEHSKLVREAVDNRKWNLINIRGSIKQVFGEKKFIFNTVPAWLNYIKNCEFLITDSYHGTIFAMIFKKNFVVIERDYAGNERLKSLLSILNIKNRFYPSIESLGDLGPILKNSINYDEVNKIINVEQNKSLNFLKSSLSTKKSSDQKIEELEESLVKQKIMCFDGTKSNHNFLNEQIDELNNEKQRLSLQIDQLTQSITRLTSTKTYRYANKVKKILNVIGIKRFKLLLFLTILIGH